MAINATSPATDTPATVLTGTPPPAENVAKTESRKTHINDIFNAVLNVNVNSIPTDREVIEEMIHSHRHTLLMLKEDNFVCHLHTIRCIHMADFESSTARKQSYRL